MANKTPQDASANQQSDVPIAGDNTDDRPPFVGPRPFTRDEALIFFGRDQESRDLRALIKVNAAVLMYGQFGAGKTSLLNAGLLPLLAKEKIEILPLARVNSSLPEGISDDQIENRLVFNVLYQWSGNQGDAKDLLTTRLSEFLETRKSAVGEGEEPFRLRVLIFDQFEEIFSLYADRTEKREKFILQVREALDKDPLLRCLFVTREDNLARLDHYAPILPDSLRVRFRLDPLREKAALEAIRGPLNVKKIGLADGVAETLVKQLLAIKETDGSVKTIPAVDEFVQPVQLQVVGQALYSRLKKGEKVVTFDHIGGIDTRIQLNIRGHERPEPGGNQDEEVSAFLNAKIKSNVEVRISARGVGTDTLVSRNVDPDTDVVELEFEGGVRQWINPQQLKYDVEQRNAKLVSRGSTGVGAIEIRSDFGSARTRGVADLVLKGLKIIRLDPVGATADQSVRLAISQFEGKLDPAPGLYQLRDPASVDRQIRDARELDASSPYLIFLHGTASSIAGSFGGLAPSADDKEGERVPPEDWNALKIRYGARILALQHKTLSESPVKNAIDLARLLPDGAKLHLVSHSRGGLIGELLCLRDLQDWHFKAFEKAARDRLEDVDAFKRADILDSRRAEEENIKRLAEVLRAKRLQVERFVRVACPARGTILVSKRIDLYLSVFLNVLGFIPALKASTLYAFVKATLLEITRRKADPRQLPGIEAMMPESPLIHILNQEALNSTADLAVISGDLQPMDMWKRLAALAVDLFYGEDNDLVVNTKAMYGGMQRQKNASYFFNKGPHVNHFHYFRNPGTRTKMREWVLASTGAQVEGFRTFVPKQDRFEPDTRRGESDKRPVVFLLPDLLGSVLKGTAGPVWMNSTALSRGGCDLLTKEDLQPSDLLVSHYAQLFNVLQGEYMLQSFPYDWRKSLLDEAVKGRLEQEVSECLQQGRRVSFLGHGSGGLLGLLLAINSDLWNGIVTRGGKLVMLGSPTYASGFAASLLTPLCDLNRMLNMVDQQSQISPEAMFRTFPGVLELIDPKLKAVLRLSDVEGNYATTLQNELAKVGNPNNVVYVAGVGERTPVGLLVDGNGQATAVTTTGAGDGHITWENARMDSVVPYQLSVSHGNMLSFTPAAAAIRDLLSRGSTERLPKLTIKRAVEDTEPIKGNGPLFYPTDLDVADAALGEHTEASLEQPELPLRLSISHGHLRHSKFPLMVGHYNDDTIVSAEKVLDRSLKGRLTKRFSMGVYPGSEQTSEIVTMPEAHPPGALVIGLGEVGELTVERVRRSVTAAAVRYALSFLESAGEDSTSAKEVRFSALLIGAYGEINVRDSITAIVNGAIEANRHLNATVKGAARVTEIEFIDLYEDVAIEAAHELLTLADRMNGDLTAGQILEAAATVRALEGGQSSRPLNQYQSGWWRRIKISRAKGDSGNLDFTVLTDRARADDFVQGTQRRLVDAFVQEAMGSTDYDKDLSATLFQLLVPRTLRDLAGDKVSLVLVVDKDSAQYPWELLAQRTRTGVDALATSCGLLRQFRSERKELPLGPASGRSALIVGDTQSGWAPLPGAREEAITVENQLRGRYDTHRLPPDVSGLALVSELVSREYRVVHLAGHGQFDPEDPGRSGMKIGGDLWLTPSELRGMLAAPDLVFVNCCHLGSIARTEKIPGPHLAASFAETLMNIGVKAVVTAGWAVDDAAGKTFAERLYVRMLEGVTFGDAVVAARQRTEELHPNRNTWGAYQCYGNPDFRLIQATSDDASGASSMRRYVARLEILQRLQDIAAMANDMSKEKVRAELERLRQDTPVSWRDGEVLAAFGQAYAAIGLLDDAIGSYQQALADESSKARLNMVQDMANLMERHARQMEASQRSELTQRAIELLLDLGRVVKTGQHAAVLGGFYKRQGEDAEGDQRKTAWKQSFACYQEAFDKRKQIDNEGLLYPGLNVVALAYVLGEPDPEKWKAVLKDSAASAAQRRQTSPDFYSRAAVPDALLLECLWDQNLVNKEADVIAAYLDVIEGSGRVTEFDSMVKQLNFLVKAVPLDVQPALQRIWEVVSSRIPR